MAGIIKYKAPIENASGKIFGKKEQWISVTRKAGNAIRNCRVAGVITKPASLAMKTHRNAFKLASAYAKRVMDNEDLRVAAEAKFAKQKECISLRGWLVKDYFATGGSISEEM